MKNRNSLYLSFLIMLAFGNLSWAATTEESLSNARQFSIRGQVGIRSEGGNKVYQATKLAEGENEQIVQLVTGLGYVMQSRASISKDGTIFALATKGQGSQAEIFLVIVVSGKSLVLPVTSVTPSVVTFKGGTLEISTPKNP